MTDFSLYNDTREAILSRLQVILEGVPSVVGVWRDRGVLPRIDAPAIIMLDGTERRLTSFTARDGVSMPPAIFQLKPQVAIVLPQRDTVQNLTLGGGALPIGPALSAYRVLIVSAVLGDQDLINIATNASGQISYDGFDSDFKTGDDIGAFGAFLIFNFSFSYVVDPSLLANPSTVAAATAEIAARWS